MSNNTALYSTGGANGNGLNPGGLTLNTNFPANLTGNGSLSAGAALNNGQNSPSFPPSPSMAGGDNMNGPYSAMASLGGYGMGFGGLMGMGAVGMNGMNFAGFGGLNSPSNYGMSPSVGSFPSNPITGQVCIQILAPLAMWS